MPEMKDKSPFVRMEVIEDKVETAIKHIEKLKTEQASLDRITTITEIHLGEMQKREQKQEVREERQDTMLSNLNLAITNMTSTLNNINLNLNKLNSGQDELEKRIGKIEDNNKIDIPATIKQILWVGIPTIIIGAVMLWMGLK
jgi:chromosome segregation ATPase